MEKNILRKKYLKIRKDISPENKEKYDKEILEKIIDLKEFKHAEKIFTYVSLTDEVDTKSLIDYCIKIGKEVAVPKCSTDDTIEFYEIKSFNDLKAGKFGILEPEKKEKISNFENSICIVPGIAFDNDLNRVGFGKGYYDRFLKNYDGIKIGLCYKECICERIDVDEYDIKIDNIITN